MRKLLFFLLLGLSIYVLPKFCADKTDGFTLLKIHSDLKFDERWATPPSIEKDSLQVQTFTYLASGGQCYAFVSQDQKIVLKLFKHHRHRLPWLITHLPLPSFLDKHRQRQLSKREKKLVRDFTGYKLAYDQLREESGLIYLHLNKTSDLNTTVTIIDKLGIAHPLNLDEVEFVVQKKADLVYDYLENLIQKREEERAKQAIDSILTFLKARCQKGIFDEDPRLHANLGFCEGKPLLIDVGRLKVDPSRKNDLKKMTQKLDLWLKDKSPALAQHLENQLDE